MFKEHRLSIKIQSINIKRVGAWLSGIISLSSLQYNSDSCTHQLLVAMYSYQASTPWGEQIKTLFPVFLCHLFWEHLYYTYNKIVMFNFSFLSENNVMIKMFPPAGMGQINENIQNFINILSFLIITTFSK